MIVSAGAKARHVARSSGERQARAALWQRFTLGALGRRVPSDLKRAPLSHMVEEDDHDEVHWRAFLNQIPSLAR